MLRRTFLTMASVLILSGGFLYAQPMGGGMMHGGMGDCGMGMMADGGMMGCSMMRPLSPHTVTAMFNKAIKSVDGDLVEEVRNLKEVSLEKILRKKTELQIAKMKLKDVMSDPNFSKNDLLKAIDDVNKAELQLDHEMVNTLAQLRDLIGPETYKSLQSGMINGGPKGMKPMMRHGRMGSY